MAALAGPLAIAMLVWLLAAPFVFVYVAIGLAMEALFGIRLGGTDGFDGPDSSG